MGFRVYSSVRFALDFSSCLPLLLFSRLPSSPPSAHTPRHPHPLAKIHRDPISPGHLHPPLKLRPAQKNLTETEISSHTNNNRKRKGAHITRHGTDKVLNYVRRGDVRVHQPHRPRNPGAGKRALLYTSCSSRRIYTLVPESTRITSIPIVLLYLQGAVPAPARVMPWPLSGGCLECTAAYLNPLDLSRRRATCG